jgi:hypothetical protein
MHSLKLGRASLRASPPKTIQSLRERLLLVCRQAGNYQLINIKVPADCFVPRLVTENALGSCILHRDLGSGLPEPCRHLSTNPSFDHWRFRLNRGESASNSSSRLKHSKAIRVAGECAPEESGRQHAIDPRHRRSRPDQGRLAQHHKFRIKAASFRDLL